MNEVATTQAFQDRMFAKIRDQMGDLMTDDDLKKLVESAMQKAFFEERTVPDGHYGTKKVPPYFITLIQGEMEKQVAKAASNWVAEHPEEVNKVIKETIEAGVFTMMKNHFESKTQWPLQQLISTLQSKGLI